MRDMPTSLKKLRRPSVTPAAAEMRSWRVAILGNRAQYLSDVQAPDEAADD
jgi:hypothetical protein